MSLVEPGVFFAAFADTTYSFARERPGVSLRFIWGLSDLWVFGPLFFLAMYRHDQCGGRALTPFFAFPSSCDSGDLIGEGRKGGGLSTLPDFDLIKHTHTFFWKFPMLFCCVRYEERGVCIL